MCCYYSHSTDEATETRERYMPWAIELCAQRLDFFFSIWLQNVGFNHSMLLPASFVLFFFFFPPRCGTGQMNSPAKYKAFPEDSMIYVCWVVVVVVEVRKKLKWPDILIPVASVRSCKMNTQHPVSAQWPTTFPQNSTATLPVSHAVPEPCCSP